MNKIIILSVLFIILQLSVFCKDCDNKEILKEGRLLFRLEKAAWFGTDYFMQYFKDKKDSIGGYLAYFDKNENVNFIFYSRYDSSHVLARFTFDSIPKPIPKYTDVFNVFAFPNELELIHIRQNAVRQLYENKDKFFTFYENVIFNPVPIIYKGQKKVYILSATQEAGKVLLGNDYVLYYDDDGDFDDKKKIHNSIIELPTQSDTTKDKFIIKNTYHTHILDDCISVTDICTLLLYRDLIEWETHDVYSQEYLTIFNLKSENLFTLTKEAMDKIYKNKK